MEDDHGRVEEGADPKQAPPGLQLPLPAGQMPGGGDGGAVRDLRARRTSASPRGGAKVLMCSHHMAETEALGHSLGPCSPLALHTQPRTGLHQTAPRKGGP